MQTTPPPASPPQGLVAPSFLPTEEKNDLDDFLAEEQDAIIDLLDKEEEEDPKNPVVRLKPSNPTKLVLKNKPTYSRNTENSSSNLATRRGGESAKASFQHGA